MVHTDIHSIKLNDFSTAYLEFPGVSLRSETRSCFTPAAILDQCRRESRESRESRCEAAKKGSGGFTHEIFGKYLCILMQS